MISTHKRYIIALILCSILISIDAGPRISKDLISIYKNVHADNYNSEGLLKKYTRVNQCSSVDHAIHQTCLMKHASKRGLRNYIDNQSDLNEVCCFFWESIECAKDFKCNIMWAAVYSTFILDNIDSECRNVQSKDDPVCKLYKLKENLQEFKFKSKDSPLCSRRK